VNGVLRRALQVVRRPAALVAHLLFDRETISRLKSKFFPRDLIYDANYFQNDVDGPASQSAPAIAASIVNDLSPRTAIDVGCGTGALLTKLRDAGCRVVGLEYAGAAREMCRERGLDVRPFDIARHALDYAQMCDVAISMEVAEHLPAQVADRYVDLLARLGKTVVFTAALPGQGGTDHVNEQPHEYWIRKFQERDCALDWTLTSRWRQSWKESGDVQSWYYNNLLVFRTAPRAAPLIGPSKRETV
jgi:SAM-dependent methyltransferase